LTQALQIEVNRAQGKFLSLNVPYAAFVGGFGSGKTTTLCLAPLIHALAHPRITMAYYAPTYPMIDDIFFPAIEREAKRFGLTVEILKAKRNVNIFLRLSALCNHNMQVNDST